MKKLFYIVSACLCMTSCGAAYFQICEVGSQLPQVYGKHYVYQDEACSVFYDFWSRGGNPGFEFTNNTDEIIYVDLSKSFFIKNGEAHDYYLNRTVATSSSYATSASASKSGTVQGYWSTGYAGYGASAPGFASKVVAVSESSSRSTEVRFEENPIVAIPPHTSKYFTEYSVCSEYFYNCEYNVTPRIKETSFYTFQSTNTPISFENYITYRIGDNPEEYSFTNEFYISSIGYYREEAVYEYEYEGCENERRQKRKVFNCVAPDKFYIKYDR